MTPRPDLSSRASWRWWLILWVAVGVAEAILLSNNAAADTFLWRTTRWFMGDQAPYHWKEYKEQHLADKDAPFYERVDPPLNSKIYARTESLWRVCRDCGEPFMTVVLMGVLFLYDRRRVKAVMLLLGAAVAAGLSGALLRMVTGRFRPDAEMNGISNEGGNHWEWFRGFHTGSDLSFPSGHATLAFGMAAALCYLSPRGRPLFVAVACGCAVARVVMQAHFFGDVIFGGALGWSMGSLAVLVFERFAVNGAQLRRPDRESMSG